MASSEKMNKLMQGLEKAQQLMKVTQTSAFNKYASDKGRDGSLMSEDFSIDDYVTSSNHNQNLSISQNVPNKGLPQAIYESIMENPLNPNNDNALDELFSHGKIKKLNNNEQKKTYSDYVNEEKIVQNQSQNQPIQVTGGNIDYSLIKLIIEDVIEKKLDDIKSKILNESVNKQPSIASIRFNGNKFHFLTNNGDVYEADLKYIKNIKDNKNKK